MKVTLYKAHCFHFHRLFNRHSIFQISVSTSLQTSTLHLRKSLLAILKIWYISQYQVAPQSFFSVGTRMEMETFSLIIGMFVRKDNVEEVNIK